MVGLKHYFREAKITNVNHRTENHGKKEKVVGYDLTIKSETNVDFLHKMAFNADPDYEKLFYGEDGEVLSLGIDKIIINRVYEEHRVGLELDLAVTKTKPNWLIKSKIKDIKVTPVFGGRVIVEFKVQCQPNDSDVIFINHACLKDVIQVHIEPTQEDLFNDKSEENPED